jgi:curli production assembly/transport component CsgG/holdfast attachment protein HfaB
MKGPAMTRSAVLRTALSGLAILAASGPALAAPRPEAPVTRNDTAYTAALSCARQSLAPRPRIAVGRISDLTGKVDFETGAKISQGASLFAITALTRAGFPVVERLDSSVSEIELNYARQKLLSDTPERAGTSGDNYRRILAGQIAGSRYYLVGGVTELNENIQSSGLNAQLGIGSGDGARLAGSERSYVLNVGLDLRLVDTQSQEVIDTVSLQKQVIGKSRDLGLLVGGQSANGQVSGGVSRMEPVQAAVRALVERAVLELTARFYDEPARRTCLPAPELNQAWIPPGPAGP